MSKFSGMFTSKNPINYGGVSVKVPTEEEAAKSFASNTFKQLDKQSGFSKGIEENKQWAKDNPGKAALAIGTTAVKWSPWGFKKYKQAFDIGKKIIKKIF